MTLRKLGILSILVLATSCLYAGSFSAIGMPTLTYLASTAKIPTPASDCLTATGPAATYSSLTDGTMTVSFSHSVISLSVAEGCWASWSSPLDSESPIPDVLYTNGDTAVTTLTLTLSKPATIFGFEAEPDMFATETMRADFYNEGGTLLGSITQDVSGDHGARLFAASDDPIMSVVFTDLGFTDLAGVHHDDDFAIAQLRYELATPTAPPPAVPEPASLILLGSGLMGLLAKRRAVK